MILFGAFSKYLYNFIKINYDVLNTKIETRVLTFDQLLIFRFYAKDYF